MLLLLGVLLFPASQAGGGFVDINIYPYMSDVDTDNTLTLNVGTKITDRLSYFSLTNFRNKDDSGKFNSPHSIYTEQNLRWRFIDNSPFDLTLQMNFRTGHDNDRHRIGVRWRLSDTDALLTFFRYLNMSYSINFHAIQFDSESAHIQQIEHVFKFQLPYLDNRFYLAGFVDHTFNENLASGIPNNPIVAESQLGFRLIDRLYLVAEYRINQYRRTDVNNVALGFEYKHTW